MVRGSLIVFEGIDGAGKTTQARHLAQALAARGHEVVSTKEPTDGPAGSRLRASARTGRLPAEEELALFVEDRRAHVHDRIAPALARGAVVIVDRYYFSTAAYQGARGLDWHEILALHETFAPRPDRLILLDVDPGVGVSRVRSRDVVENAFEREEDLRVARGIFLQIPGEFVRRFDAGLPEEELRAEILADVTRVIGRT